MKIKTQHFVFALTLGFIFALFSFKFVAGETSITLSEALKSKQINAHFSSTGNYSGNSVNAQLKNNTQKNIRILIPAATLFDAIPEEDQDMVLPQDMYVQLAPGQEKSIVLDGYCTNSSGKVPALNSDMRLSTITKKGFPELIAFAKGKTFESNVLQDAVWSLTNGNSVSNIYSSNEKDTVVRDLRSLLFKLTGQKETWYQSPQERIVSEDRNINSETLHIHGDLEFNGTKGKNVHQEIWSSSKKIFQMDDYTLKFTGKTSFKFNLKVKGWEKGNYEVRVYEGANLIKTFEFVV